MPAIAAAIANVATRVRVIDCPRVLSAAGLSRLASSRRPKRLRRSSSTSTARTTKPMAT